MTQHERSAAAVRAVRTRWSRATAEERVWTAHFLRSHQKRFQGLPPVLRPKPVRAPTPKLSALLPKVPVPAPPKLPLSPPIPTVVIPRRVREQPILRPGVRYDV